MIISKDNSHGENVNRHKCNFYSTAIIFVHRIDSKCTVVTIDNRGKYSQFSGASSIRQYCKPHQGCQFGAKRAKFLDFGFILLCLATENSVWLLSIFWLFLASFNQ